MDQCLRVNKAPSVLKIITQENCHLVSPKVEGSALREGVQDGGSIEK